MNQNEFDMELDFFLNKIKKNIYYSSHDEMDSIITEIKEHLMGEIKTNFKSINELTIKALRSIFADFGNPEEILKEYTITQECNCIYCDRSISIEQYSKYFKACYSCYQTKVKSRRIVLSLLYVFFLIIGYWGLFHILKPNFFELNFGIIMCSCLVSFCIISAIYWKLKNPKYMMWKRRMKNIRMNLSHFNRIT